MKEIILNSSLIKITLNGETCTLRKPTMDEIFDMSEDIEKIEASEEAGKQRRSYNAQKKMLTNLGLLPHFADALTAETLKDLVGVLFEGKKN